MINLTNAEKDSLLLYLLTEKYSSEFVSDENAMHHKDYLTFDEWLNKILERLQ